MKQKLSFLLALVFAVGFCCSVPVSATDNSGASTENTEITTETETTGSEVEENVVVIEPFTFKLNEAGTGCVLVGYNATEGENVVEIPTYCMTDFKSLPLPVVEIDTDVFSGINVVSITIPVTVEKMTGNGFRFMPKRKVNIESLKNWCEIEFSGDSANPLNVVSLGSDCYSELYLNGKLIEDLVIPDGISEIKPHSFVSCKSIKTITIPKSVKTIGAYAFGNIDDIEHIYYVATESETGEIEVAKSAFSEECTPLIHYNCKEHTVTYTSSTFSCVDTVKADCSCGYSWLVSMVQNEHRYIGDYCDNCGESVWGYNLLDDGTIYVYDCFDTERENVIIPSEIDGYTVTAIDLMKSKYILSNARTIVVPDTVVSIRNVLLNVLTLNANSPLEKMIIPESVTELVAIKIQKDISIYGVPGSKAEELATQYELEFVDISTVYSIDTETTDVTDGMLVVEKIEESEIQKLLKPTDDYTVSVSPKIDGVYSTGTRVQIKDKDGVTLKEHTLVVKGDTNGDGVCDVLDCMLVELARTDNTTLTRSAFLAGDIADDGEITIEDLDAVVNKATAR